MTVPSLTFSKISNEQTALSIPDEKPMAEELIYFPLLNTCQTLQPLNNPSVVPTPIPHHNTFLQTLFCMRRNL